MLIGTQQIRSAFCVVPLVGETLVAFISLISAILIGILLASVEVSPRIFVLPLLVAVVLSSGFDGSNFCCSS